MANMPKAGKILLYGFIGDSGWWTGQDNTDVRFQREFQSMENDPEIDSINLHINSPGGYVHDGMAIANIIERSEKPVNIYIDGIAYSMAAIIALHGDKVFIPSNGLFMLHNVSGGVWGNAKDLRSSADTMDKYDHSLASSIAKKTGLTVDQVKDQYLDYEDHFFTAEEALEANLVDEIEARDGDIPEEATDTTNYNLTKLAASFGQMLHNRANESPGFMTMIKNQFSRFENKLENLFGSQTSPTPPTQEPSNSHTPMKIKATWLALLAFFSLTDSAKDKEVVEHTPSEEDLENLNERLQKVTDLEKEVQTLQGSNQDLETQISNLKKERDELKAKLNASPAGSPSGSQGSGDDSEGGSNEEEDFLTDVDREAREIYALNNPSK